MEIIVIHKLFALRTFIASFVRINKKFENFIRSYHVARCLIKGLINTKDFFKKLVNRLVDSFSMIF